MESRTSITRKKKRYTESAMVDRISALPDELLSHILSFLPTKLAFTTTVLSKRWSPLCYSLPFLRFNKHWEEDYENTCNGFCRFVTTLMLSPLSTNQPLKIFSLEYSFRARERHNHLIKAWLEAANRCRVEEIHLTLNNYTSLNPIIFISCNLVVLKLEKLRIASDTSCVDLPSLKTLHLEFVEFENQNNYINFLYGCPSLQDLYAKPIYLYREMNHDENNVTDKGLRSLTLSKLVRATLRPTDIVVFNAIENVEFLSIITKSSNAEANFKVTPIFQNLIQIDLEFFGDSFCWDSVVELLRHSPKLQLLFIKKWMKNRSSKEWKCPISILECVSSHLRSCTILNLEGSASDLGFATYILQNASHLQDMTIGITNYGMLLEKSQIIEELSSCARIFSGAKVSFECNFSY